MSSRGYNSHFLVPLWIAFGKDAVCHNCGVITFNRYTIRHALSQEEAFIVVCNKKDTTFVQSTFCTFLFPPHSTLQMLTNIENKLEELFESIETMPPEKVEAAEKVMTFYIHM